MVGYNNFASHFDQIHDSNTSYHQNGRVEVTEVNKPYYNFTNTNLNKNYKCEALKGIQTSSLLSLAFFDAQNIDDLQNMIRYNIWLLSNKQYVIGRQSDQDLHLVMRSMYLQYSRNMNQDITSQVKILNTKVLDWCLPKIYSEILQYLKYKQDISTLPQPMDRASNLSNKGSKSLELKPFM